MTKTSLLARSAAAVAALVVAGSAAAQSDTASEAASRGTFTGEAGLSYLTGKTLAYRNYGGGAQDDRGLNLAFGWEHPSGFGVRALFISDLQWRTGFFYQAPQSFNNFYGVEATGALPLASTLKLKGGLGLGVSRLDDGDDHDVAHKTDGVLSAGLQWRPWTHFALELHVDHLTRTGITSTALMAQVPF